MVANGEALQHGISRPDIRKIVEQAKAIVGSDECYPKELTSELREAPSIVTEDFVAKAQKLYKTLQKSPDLDKYYTTFMEMFPLNAVKFFPHLTQPAAVLLTLKFGDCLVAYQKGQLDKTTDCGDQTAQFSLSERESHALQYLVGYVLNNLNKKIKNSVYWNTKESKEALCFLKSCKILEDETQLFVTAVNRGGLWLGNDTIQSLFTIVEEVFWLKTNKQVVTKIDSAELVHLLMNDARILGHFNILLEECQDEVPRRVALDTLEQMLALYIKVRSFSFAKSVTQKHKVEMVQGKAKALRKEIKRNSKEQAAHIDI